MKPQERFKTYLEELLELRYLELVKQKPPEKQFLGYSDIRKLTALERTVFRSALGEVPKDIEFACFAAEAVLAPDTATRMRLVRAMAVAAGGAGGIAAILTGLAGIFGWGAGVLWTIHAFFLGVALGGPLAWVAAGISVAMVAAYFALSSDEPSNSDKAFKALKSGCDKAIDAIWSEHGEILAEWLNENTK